MRTIDRIVDIVNKHPRLVYQIQSLISKDRSVQREIFQEILEPVFRRFGESIDILDIASGSGHFAQIFSRTANLYLTDVSFENCKFTANRFDRPAIAIDARKLPFADESFDLLTCSAAFHHLSTRDAKTVMEEAHRVLRKDGVFLLMDSYIPRKPGIAPLFFEWVERGEFLRSKNEMLQIAGHNSLFGITEQIDEREKYHFQQLYLLLTKSG